MAHVLSLHVLSLYVLSLYVLSLHVLSLNGHVLGSYTIVSLSDSLNASEAHARSLAMLQRRWRESESLLLARLSSFIIKKNSAFCSCNGLQWAHNSVGDTSKSKVALKKRSNNNELPAISEFAAGAVILVVERIVRTRPHTSEQRLPQR